MIYLNLLFICAITVFICDLSGAVDDLIIPLIKRAFKLPKNANISIKPLSCSLCMVWWLGLIYLLITSTLTLANLSYVCLLAFLTPHVRGILLYMKEVLIFIENNLYKLIDESK